MSERQDLTGDSKLVAGHQSSVGDHGHHDHHHCDHDGGACLGALDKSALISARGLTFRRGGRAILQGIDLDIHRREIVTLIGPNGAGKTTLVRMMLGLQQADSGELSRSGDLVIGYVPQRFDIDAAIPMTVARFLALGLAAAAGADRSGKSGWFGGGMPGRNAQSKAAIGEVLAEVGAAQLEDRQLAKLSGGELQRVLLARALLRRPDLIVLDEPVRGVDYAGEAALYSLISRIRDERGLGVLLVSHDLHIVMAQSTRVICLNGHICCSGVPDRVAQHPEYERLFGPQAARALGLYRHNHDHSHDLSGAPIPKVVSVDTPAGDATVGVVADDVGNQDGGS